MGVEVQYREPTICITSVRHACEPQLRRLSDSSTFDFPYTILLPLSLSLSLSLLSFHLLSIVCSVHMFLCLCQSTIRSKRYDRLNSYLCLGICEYLGIGLNTSWSFPFCKPFLSIFQHPILLLNLFIFTVRVCLPRWYFVPCCFSQETFSSCLSTVPISLYALSCQTLCLSFHT